MGEDDVPSAPGRVDSSAYESHIPTCRLYIGNLDIKLREFHMVKLLQRFGKIVDFQFPWWTAGPKKGEPRGFVFVEYETIEIAEKALRSLHGKKLTGRTLVVHFATDRGSHRTRKKVPMSTSHPTSGTSSLPERSMTAKKSVRTVVVRTVEAPPEVPKSSVVSGLFDEGQYGQGSTKSDAKAAVHMVVSRTAPGPRVLHTSANGRRTTSATTSHRSSSNSTAATTHSIVRKDHERTSNSRNIASLKAKLEALQKSKEH